MTIKKLFIISALILTACTPNEADFKSTIPPLEDRVMQVLDENQELPKEINLNIPFFSQAPDGDWGMPWQESCEEASVTLAVYYATDQPLNKELFKKEILGLVDWQNEHFGNYEHTTADQTVEMMKGYFYTKSSVGQDNYPDLQNIGIINNPSIDDLKKELAEGNPIVAPFAGRKLGNPFYSGEGPYYHMMVIKGYDEKNFITNDVGTRRGENFIYPYQTLISAMHDWHETDISLGKKKVIVVRPASVDEEGKEK